MDFGWALDRLWEGAKVMRKIWAPTGYRLELVRTDQAAPLTSAYLCLVNLATGTRALWTAPHADLLGQDWTLAPEC